MTTPPMPSSRSFRHRYAGAAAAMLALLLSACVGGPSAPTRRIATAPRAPVRSAPSLDTRQCMASLATAQVRYDALPDRDFGGGCTAFNSVKLLDIGTPVTNLGSMTCPLAAKFAAWARYAVQPAARLVLGAEIVRIDTFGTYNCRAIAGGAKLSEHAHANAVDVAAFVLADGRRITVKGDWSGSGRGAKFLRVVHDSACKRFMTVLSPGYNAAHHDHFHFDMGGVRNFCA